MSIRSFLSGLLHSGTPLPQPNPASDGEVLRVISVEAADAGTALICDGANGLTTVLVPAAPTAQQAERWRRLIRVDRVEITVTGPDAQATIHGVGHRIPTRRTVPVSVGLALLADGVRGHVIVRDAPGPLDDASQ